ncbi:alpha/beta fold hydrolase [Halostreptopolyspora alba]|uniref:Alpha/beta hydrolase n=1 Tax=Halostreptopolyspora alba TaxID=2487137 RepID=A0A3N0E9Q6_9ACTN|nr:alpha/beta hydrolase [Nocardiopsaceae bacterium YIM 96095]
MSQNTRTDDGGSEGAPERSEQRPGRRRRWLRWTAILLVVAVGAWLAVRDTSPVGHFTSAEGHQEYVRAYERAMEDLPEPDATLDLRTDYGVVRVYRFDGAAPEKAPLVFLPGRSSASPVLAGNLASLLEIRTVYTVDLLGEPGASIQTRPIRDGADQARWLHQALAELPESTVHLLGLSIGGWSAMNLAIRKPDTLASVIALDPAMTFADMPLETMVRSIPASVGWFPKSWRDQFNSWTAGGAPVEDVAVADMIETGMRHYSMKLPAPRRFSSERLETVDLPVLAIIAGESVMHDSGEAARRAEDTLSRATVVTYEDASHAINGEYPEEIAADIDEFLDDAD